MFLFAVLQFFPGFLAKILESATQTCEYTAEMGKIALASGLDADN